MDNSNYWDGYEKEVREWIPNCGNKLTFFRDGIVDCSTFSNANIRPLFILREVNDRDGCIGCEHNNTVCEHRSKEIEDGKPQWVDLCKCENGIISLRNLWAEINRLAQIFITNNDINQAAVIDNNYINQAAVINLKKIGGGNNVNSPESYNGICYVCHARKFADRIKEQITEINPTVIIACGTFDALKKTNIIDNIVGSYTVCDENHPNNNKDWRIAKLKDTKIRVLEIYHPSYWGIHKAEYNNLINYWSNPENLNQLLNGDIK